MAGNGRLENHLLKSIEEITQIRERNNGFWMGILYGFCEQCPEQALELLEQIITHDTMVVEELTRLADILKKHTDAAHKAD